MRSEDGPDKENIQEIKNMAAATVFRESVTFTASRETDEYTSILTILVFRSRSVSSSVYSFCCVRPTYNYLTHSALRMSNFGRNMLQVL